MQKSILQGVPAPGFSRGEGPGSSLLGPASEKSLPSCKPTTSSGASRGGFSGQLFLYLRALFQGHLSGSVWARVSKRTAKLWVSSAERTWGWRGQLAATCLPAAGSRAGPGAVLSAVFALHVRGKEYNKVCFPLFLPFFIPDLSSDLQISSSTRMIKKGRLKGSCHTQSFLSLAPLGCAGQNLSLFSLARCSQASEMMLFITGVSPRPPDNYW